MGKPAIIEKLDEFLKKHMPPDEECLVVYLLVEIRKILDHENNGKYPISRFYSDWCVHTAKDRITPQIKVMMEGIHKEFFECQVKGRVVNKEPELKDFLSMNALRMELKGFFQEMGLPDSIIEIKNWAKFQKLLIRILADQPINKPCDGIKKFSYTIDAGGDSIAEIEYETQPAKYLKFRFGGINIVV